MGVQRLPSTPVVPPSHSPLPAALHTPKVVTGSEGGLVAVVQPLSRVRLFVTPRTAARQASLSFTVSPRACSNSCPLSQ